jgi:hypothetical protein
MEDFHLKYLSLLKIKFLNLKLLQKLFKRLLCMENHKTQSIYTTRPNPYTPQDLNHIHHIKIYYETSLIFKYYNKLTTIRVNKFQFK